MLKFETGLARAKEFGISLKSIRLVAKRASIWKIFFTVLLSGLEFYFARRHEPDK